MTFTEFTTELEKYGFILITEGPEYFHFHKPDKIAIVCSLPQDKIKRILLFECTKSKIRTKCLYDEFVTETLNYNYNPYFKLIGQKIEKFEFFYDNNL